MIAVHGRGASQNPNRDLRPGSVSARLGSARPGSARLGPARLGSARPGPARLGSARLRQQIQGWLPEELRLNCDAAASPPHPSPSVRSAAIDPVLSGQVTAGRPTERLTCRRYYHSRPVCMGTAGARACVWPWTLGLVIPVWAPVSGWGIRLSFCVRCGEAHWDAS